VTALVLAEDPFDGRRAATVSGSLRAFSEATVLEAADAHTASTLARLVGGADDEVVLAAALAVRAVRLGHVYVDLATVAATAAPDEEDVELNLASLPWPDPATWPSVVAASRLTAVGNPADDRPESRPLRLLGSRLYLDRYWRHEAQVAADLRRRSTAEQPIVDTAVASSGLARLFGPGPAGADDDLQRLAAATVLLRRFAVVAGGPGTGKTTTVARILALLHEQAAALGLPPPRVALAAPTGKAAARLAEAVHHEAASLDVDPTVRKALLATPASTLHRLLGWQPGSRSRFRHDATNPLGHTTVIVDESSMVSLSLMASLLAAVRPSARLVLVGDPRQLASVEAGAVLGDIVGGPGGGAGLRLSAAARSALEGVTGRPVAAVDPGPEAVVADGIIVLRRVHRFGAGVAAVAEAIDGGDPDRAVAALRAGAGGVGWIEVAPEVDVSRAPELAGVRRAVVAAASAVVDAARTGDGRAALDALGSVQVLCAHRRGPGGAASWRSEIERWLRSALPGHGAGGSRWYAGRPLLVTENDHALGVFNGDTGVVVDLGGGRLRAVFDRRGALLSLPLTRLGSVESLSAMTIHKAQGSQFGAVVVVLPNPTSRALTRELLYTAVTRAQESLTLVGPEASVRAAVGRPIARASGLGDALWPPPVGVAAL
jgi:exodeoxyribonuclease V alpha subunit